MKTLFTKNQEIFYLEIHPSGNGVYPKVVHSCGQKELVIKRSSGGIGDKYPISFLARMQYCGIQYKMFHATRSGAEQELERVEGLLTSK